MTKLLGEPRQQRSGIISALYAGERPMCKPFSGIAATISASNCRPDTWPPSSVGRAHPCKENLGLFSSSGDQQEQPFAQVKADRSIWIKWQRLAVISIG
jgi:hypothetical protein